MAPSCCRDVNCRVELWPKHCGQVTRRRGRAGPARRDSSGQQVTGQPELGPADAGADHHRSATSPPGRPPAPASDSGSPIGVIPPYSMPVSAVTASTGPNDALRAPRCRRTSPLTSARVVAVTMQAAYGHLRAALGRDDHAVRALLERDPVGLAELRGVGQGRVDRGHPDLVRPRQRAAARRRRAGRAGRAAQARGDRSAAGS